MFTDLPKSPSYDELEISPKTLTPRINAQAKSITDVAVGTIDKTKKLHVKLFPSGCEQVVDLTNLDFRYFEAWLHNNDIKLLYLKRHIDYFNFLRIYLKKEHEVVLDQKIEDRDKNYSTYVQGIYIECDKKSFLSINRGVDYKKIISVQRLFDDLNIAVPNDLNDIYLLRNAIDHISQKDNNYTKTLAFYNLGQYVNQYAYDYLAGVFPIRQTSNIKKANKMAWDYGKGGWMLGYKYGMMESYVEYDLKSAYPYELMKLPDLTTGEWSHRELDNAALGFCDATIEITSDISPFSISVSQGDSALFPVGTWRTIITYDQLKFLKKHPEIGRIIKIHDGIWFKNDELFSESPFKLIADIGIKKRDNSELENKFYKMVLNRLHGKFNEVWSPSLRNKTYTASPLFSPVYYTTVTARVRLKMMEALLANQHTLSHLIKVHTDGIAFDREVNFNSDLEYRGKMENVLFLPPTAFRKPDTFSTLKTLLCKEPEHPAYKYFEIENYMNGPLENLGRPKPPKPQYYVVNAIQAYHRLWKSKSKFKQPFTGQDLLEKSYNTVAMPIEEYNNGTFLQAS